MPAETEPKVSCPVETALRVIGGKWKCVILWFLKDRAYRTGELRRQIPGVSEKMLIQQLRALEADGLVQRRVHQEVPPRVQYSLTAHGRALEPTLDALSEWGRKHARRMTRR